MSTGLSPHIYNSLLSADVSDVALHVQGRRWSAVYLLHRVVLVQAGFFRSLFTSGFQESDRHNHVDLIFEDPNITRQAFELCISRLYGGGPPLHVEPSLIQSATSPLLPNCAVSQTPAGHQHATPRLLLSLLATAVYLSIPSLASSTLLTILNTIGPQTILIYLDFARGKGIPNQDEDDESAVGLQSIAKPFRDPTREDVDCSASVATVSTRKASGDDDASFISVPSLMLSYGPVSDKIGEASASWLARWGSDIFALEETSCSTPRRRATVSTPPGSPPLPISFPPIWSRSGLPASWVRGILSSDSLFVKGERERYDLAVRIVESRRNVGIDEEEEKEWDELFSIGIYYLHMSPSDLILLSQQISPSTGRTYVPLSVLQAAHWAQTLLRQDVTKQSRDKELGITLSSAEVSELKGRTPTAFYPIASDSSLRFGDSSGVEGATMEELFEGIGKKDKKYSIKTDESNFFGLLANHRATSLEIANSEDSNARWTPYPPFRFGAEFWGIDTLKEKNRLHSHTVWYAGSLFNVYVQVVKAAKKGGVGNGKDIQGLQLGVYLHRQSCVDPIPPASAPSFYLRSMGNIDKERVGSRTRGYSSPHQQPPSSLAISSSGSSGSSSRSPSRNHALARSVSPTPTSNTSGSSPPSPSSPNHRTHSNISPVITVPPTVNTTLPVQPYRDPRPAVMAYFTIQCASATGSSLTRFASVPDVFAVSQSWGWKSSSLGLSFGSPEHNSPEYATHEGHYDGGKEGEYMIPSKVPEISLRATIVIGLI